jgi:hypothetical protein
MNKANNQQLRISLGVNSFKELLLENDIIVDKSLLVKSVLEAPAEAFLITRPRRWGKSINLDMLKTFFEIEVDSQGQPLSLTQKTNYKLFAGGTVNLDTERIKKLQPLKIANYPEVMKYQGQYPVVLLDFKDANGNNYQEIENNIVKKVQNAYEKHIYLANSSQLRTDEKQLFQKYLQSKITKADLQDSLRFLSEILYKHFNQKTYILIDEYDAIINDAYSELETKEFDKVLDLFRTMLGTALKGNVYLKKGILTGILRVAKVKLLSSLNNVIEYSLLNKRFTEHYGFTQAEVDELLNKVPTITDPQLIKNWYNGYTYGEETVYNPWSIMCCLAEGGVVDNYWIDSGGTGLINKALISDKVQVDLQMLLKGQSIIKSLYRHIALDQIEEDRDILYSLLVFAGYLNPKPANSDPEEPLYELTIPNQEIKQIYKDRVIKWVTRKLGIEKSEYNNFINLLLNQEIEKFVERLNECLMSSTSYHDLIKERDYHNLIGGILTPLSGKYIITSNQESGCGRADHILIPKSNILSNVAFIIEYKLCAREEELENATKIGLQQINNQHYNAQVKQHPQVKKIIKLALAFYSKKVVAEHETESV